MVGAARCGTTSLFEYLRKHPEILMPESKEVPFFSNETVFGEGFESYFKGVFPDCSGSTLLGTVTPQYMENPVVPARMASHFPELKLVAILRNPVDRAYSAYQLMRRKGWEERCFEEVVEAQLEQNALQVARELNPTGSEVRDCVSGER